MDLDNLKLPVSSNSEGDLAHFDNMSQDLDLAKTADKKHLIGQQAQKIGKILDLAGRFEMAFKYSSLYCKAEFQISKDGVGMDRHFKDRKFKDIKHKIKKAYSNLGEDELKDGFKKLKSQIKMPTREYFLAKGKPFFSGDFEWYTPPWVYERCRLVMGSIDLDPATSAQAIEMGNKPNLHFTKSDNALIKTWPKVENIFINPPYTLKPGEEESVFKDQNKKIEKSGAKAFLIKLLNSHFRRAMLLVLEDSGTSYGQFLWGLSNAVFIPSGRLHFIYEGKSKGKSTTRTNLIFGIGVDEIKFYLAFRDYGQTIFQYKTPREISNEIALRHSDSDIIEFNKKLKALPRSVTRDKRAVKDYQEVQNLKGMKVWKVPVSFEDDGFLAQDLPKEKVFKKKTLNKKADIIKMDDKGKKNCEESIKEIGQLLFFFPPGEDKGIIEKYRDFQIKALETGEYNLKEYRSLRRAMGKVKRSLGL